MSMVVSTRSAVLSQIGNDPEHSDFCKYTLVNGAVFFEAGGNHLQIMPMAAEITVYQDYSKISSMAPAMGVPMPKVSVVEQRDGRAGRVDAAEFLMKHLEVRNYMSQVYTADGAQANDSRTMYIVEDDQVSLDYHFALHCRQHTMHEFKKCK